MSCFDEINRTLVVQINMLDIVHLVLNVASLNNDPFICGEDENERYVLSI